MVGGFEHFQVNPAKNLFGPRRAVLHTTRVHRTPLRGAGLHKHQRPHRVDHAKPIRPPYLCRGNGRSFIPLPHGRNRASSASPAPAAPSRRRRWLKSNSVCAWSSPSPYWTQAQVRHRPRPLPPVAAPAALPCWHNLRVCLPSLSASFSLFSLILKISESSAAGVIPSRTR